MRQEIIQYKRSKEHPEYVNSEIRICIICGSDNIVYYQFGISCEECGTLFGRKKC